MSAQQSKMEQNDNRFAPGDMVSRSKAAEIIERGLAHVVAGLQVPVKMRNA